MTDHVELARQVFGRMLEKYDSVAVACLIEACQVHRGAVRVYLWRGEAKWSGYLHYANRDQAELELLLQQIARDAYGNLMKQLAPLRRGAAEP